MDQSDINAIKKAFTDALKDVGFAGNGGGRSFGAKSSRAGGGDDDGASDKSRKELIKANKQLVDQIGKSITMEQQVQKSRSGVLEANEEYQTTADKANDALRSSTLSFGALDDELDKMARKSIPEQRFYLSKLSKINQDLTTETAKTIRTQSLLGASLLESQKAVEHGSNTYFMIMDEMQKASAPLSKGFLKAAGIIDETTGEMKEGLNEKTFSSMRVSIGEASGQIDETFGKLTELKFGALSDAFKSGTPAIEKFFGEFKSLDDESMNVKSELAGLALRLQKEGFDLGPVASNLTHKEAGVNAAGITHEAGGIDHDAIAKLSAEDLKNLTIAINSVKASCTASAAGLDKIGRIANDSGAVFFKRMSTFNGMLGVAAEKLGKIDGGSMMAKGLEMMKDAAVQEFKVGQAFNNAQLPAHLLDVQTAAVGMGMSMEDTTKFLQENKRAFALSGQTATEFTGQFKKTFEDVGITMKDGAAAVGPAMEAAAASGVNMRSGDDMNAYMAKTMNSFKNISGIVNITAAEYAKQNATMLESDDVQATLLGMNKEQAAAYSDNLIAMKDYYVQQGLTTEMAAEAVKMQQAQKHTAVRDQLKTAGMMQLRASHAGLSQQEGQRQSQLYLKQNKSEAENKEFLALNAKVAKGMTERQQQANEAGTNASLNEQNLQQATSTGDIEKNEKFGLEADMAARNKKAVNPEQAAALAKASAGDKLTAQAGNLANTTSEAADTPLGKAAIGLATIFGGLILASTSLAAVFGQMAITGAAGGAANAAGGILSKVGSVGGGAAKLLGKVAAPLAAGAAAYEGISDEASGKHIESVGDIIPEGWNKLNPFAYAMNGGRYVGNKINNAIGPGGLSPSAAVDPNFHTPEELAKLAAAKKAHDAKVAAGATPASAADTGVGAQLAQQSFDQSTSTPINTPPPMVGAPGKPTSESDVNKSVADDDTEEDETMDVQDTTAHGYLTTIADSMVQAVKLLQTISDNGNSDADAALANLKSATTGGRKVPTASSYLTGRAMA